MKPSHDFSRLLSFDRKELLAILMLSLLLAFILTFRMWGGDEFDAVVGASNLIVVFLGMIFMVGAHEFGHKLAGAAQGHHVRIIPFSAGLIGSFFVSLYTRGFLPIITPNLLDLDCRPDLRLQRFRKYENPQTGAIIAGAGLIGNIVAIIIFKLLFAATGFALFKVMVWGAVLHTFYSLIPFELLSLLSLRFMSDSSAMTPGDGIHIFWYHPYAYVFAMVTMLIFGAIALATGTISIVFTLVLGLLVTWFYAKTAK